MNQKKLKNLQLIQHVSPIRFLKTKHATNSSWKQIAGISFKNSGGCWWSFKGFWPAGALIRSITPDI